VDVPSQMQPYYEYLFGFYLRNHWPVTWEWFSLYNNARYVLIFFGWLILMAWGLYRYTRYQSRARWKNDLYPPEEYSGYLQEHVGPVGGGMTWFYWFMFFWMLTLTIQQLIQGQVY